MLVLSHLAMLLAVAGRSVVGEVTIIKIKGLFVRIVVTFEKIKMHTAIKLTSIIAVRDVVMESLRRKGVHPKRTWFDRIGTRRQ